MIIGTGTDIIEISRITKAVGSQRFMEKIYTDTERRKKSLSTLSGYFAAKEAVAKALGTGFNKIRPNEIEIVNSPMGKPYVNLYGKAKKQAQALGVRVIHISISHSRDLAIAIAIAEK